MKYILALDQGTTSSRALVFDKKGRVKATAQKEFKQRYPKPGWVEHDPLEIWATQNSVAVEAIGLAGCTSSDIAAIGITNQRETTVIWDRKSGKPVYPAIVWQDRRTASFCDALRKEGHEEDIRARTGLLPDAYFSATKIKWILDHVKGARRRAEKGELAFGTIDSWLIWKLTGGNVHATDATNASRTMLFNIHTLDWDPHLLKLLDIPAAILPAVKDSSDLYGETIKRSALAGIPITGVAGDQQAALFGQGCFTPGMAKNTYGTGCFLLMNTGRKPVLSKNNLLTTVAWCLEGRAEYALEGSVFIGGALFQWLRDGLELARSASEIDTLAASVKDNGGVYLVPAFAGLGAPHWDPYARGTLIGVTRGTTKAHIARAAIESVAYQSYDVLKAMESDAGLKLHSLRVDGGACRSKPLMQFQSDLLRVPVVRPRNIETTALGAAALAGLAVGFWKNRDDLIKALGSGVTFKPSGKPDVMATQHATWQRALERAKNWVAPE